MPDESTQTAQDALAGRRWLIGVCISVTFGLFGVVMALLSRFQSAPATGVNQTTTRGAQPAPPSRASRHADRRNP